MGTLFKVKIRKIGTSLGVLIPKEMIQMNDIKVGEEVEISLLIKRKELIKKMFGITKGAKGFERDYEEDRV
jgi:antitoxin component of MazEF toxin-antitoxin module